MCEQCAARTTMYVLEKVTSVDDWGDKQEPLPGFMLVRATVDGTVMKAGEWGLVRCDDPDFVWSETPTPDKFWGMTDEQLDLLPEHEQEAISVHEEQAYAFGRQMMASLVGNQYRCHFEAVGSLMDACKAKGWNPEEHHLERWLFNYLGLWLQAAVELKHGE